MLLGGLQLATPEEVIPEAWLVVEGDRVATVGRGVPPGTPDVDLSGSLVVPGFVDLHCHGGGGASYGSDDPTPAVTFHRWHGTTTTLASLASAGPDQLADQVRALAETARDGIIEGIHLEGPFLSVARCGAHDPTVLRDPTARELDHLIALAGGTLRMMTLAPERPGAHDAITRLTQAGVLAAIGHTDATFEQTRAAIAAGAWVATHLGNAMAPLHQRQPGPILALLEDDRVVCELINDAMHVHPALISHVLRSAGSTRIAMITDAMAAAGVGDGKYSLGGVAVRVVHGEPRVEATGVLAGSTLTLDEAFRRAVTDTGFSIPDAVRATSTTPARLLGRGDIGRLGPGSRADLAALDADLRISAVLHHGTWASAPF